MNKNKYREDSDLESDEGEASSGWVHHCWLSLTHCKFWISHSLLLQEKESHLETFIQEKLKLVHILIYCSADSAESDSEPESKKG